MDTSSSKKISRNSSVSWSWINYKKNYLSFSGELYHDHSYFKLTIQPNGEILQEALHPKDQEPSFQKLGNISETERAQWLDQLDTYITKKPSEDAISNEHEKEGYALEYRSEDGTQNRFEWPITLVKQNPLLQSIRKLFLNIRKKVRKSCLNPFQSAGGRWLLVTLALVLALSYWIVKDWRSVNQLEKEALRTKGEVVSREGGPYVSNKSITVRFQQNGQSKTARISDYLSAENWNNALSGSSVNLWVDPKTSKAWVESDLLRWQRTKKQILLFPLFFFALAFIGFAWLNRYQIGQYTDGQEYLIFEDRIVSDDKNYPISRFSLNMVRLGSRFLK